MRKKKITWNKKTLERISEIVAEETGEERYRYAALQEHNRSLKIEKATGWRKLIWECTHERFWLAMVVCVVIFGVVLGLPLGLCLGAIPGILIGALAGFLFAGVYLAGLGLSNRCCDACESLKTNEEYYRHLLSSKDELVNRELKDDDGHVIEKHAVAVRKEEYAVYRRCSRCGTLTLDMDFEEHDK